ncbi:MAG: toprim domain-containing protein [Rikenellaceae bacterium]
MNNIKNISIKNYLTQCGAHPITERGRIGLYLSPFRSEMTPSFKVDYNKNLWYDFGVGEGGSVVDLVMCMENCTLAEAFRRLEESDFSALKIYESQPLKEVAPIQIITDVKPLANPQLLAYLTSRKIDLDIAKEYCDEVHYTTYGKPYFAIGFRNDMGGYELRNKFYKGGTSPKAPTTISAGSDETTIFEGFMDFLSYKTLSITPDKVQNISVLNSVTNLKKISKELSNQRKIHSYLDNDSAGRAALQTLQNLDVDVIDHTPQFAPHKDLNDYLVNHQPQPKQRLKLR